MDEQAHRRESWPTRFLRTLWLAVRTTLQALANSSGAASAAMDDPRTEQRVKREPDVPH